MTDLEEFKAMFTLAGIPVLNTHELPNGYWPNNIYYAEIRGRHPWYLFITAYGPIKIGYRKRVLEISWEDIKLRKIVTDDAVTKELDYVHAWTSADAVKYLTTLRKEADVGWQRAEHIAAVRLCEIEGNVPYVLPDGVTEEMVQACIDKRKA